MQKMCATCIGIPMMDMMQIQINRVHTFTFKKSVQYSGTSTIDDTVQ